jgi:hypothetical protein
LAAALICSADDMSHLTQKTIPPLDSSSCLSVANKESFMSQMIILHLWNE